MRERIMYVEDKSHGLSGPARIGRVAFSKTGRTLYYGGRSFRSLEGRGFKSNYFDVATGEEFWISGPRKDGADRLYGERLPVEIDDDARVEYWTLTRGRPSRASEAASNAEKVANGATNSASAGKPRLVARTTDTRPDLGVRTRHAPPQRSGVRTPRDGQIVSIPWLIMRPIVSYFARSRDLSQNA